MDSYPNFDRLDDKKKHEILSAGFKLFGRNGYSKTSVNDIARSCGISKASLFYYFGSKENFFTYLYCFASNLIMDEMEEGGEDFFDCLVLGSRIKLRVMKSYQGIYDFLLSLVKEKDDSITDFLKGINYEEVKASTDLLFRNVDWSRFKPEVDPGTAFQLVSYVSNGFIKDHVEEPPEKILEQLYPVLYLLKKALYREEFL